jgi:hypothetical protein
VQHGAVVIHGVDGDDVKTVGMAIAKPDGRHDAVLAGSDAGRSSSGRVPASCMDRWRGVWDRQLISAVGEIVDPICEQVDAFQSDPSRQWRLLVVRYPATECPCVAGVESASAPREGPNHAQDHLRAVLVGHVLIVRSGCCCQFVNIVAEIGRPKGGAARLTATTRRPTRRRITTVLTG